MTDHIKRLAEAINHRLDLDDPMSAAELNHALSAAGLEVNKAGTREALKPFGAWSGLTLALHDEHGTTPPDRVILRATDNWKLQSDVTCGDLRTASALSEGEG